MTTKQSKVKSDRENWERRRPKPCFPKPTKVP
jgi:hypothetical protein